MSLESIHRLMAHAREHCYAVGYFESWNLDSLQGVIEAAERTRSPMIIGFNGEFLSQRAGATLEEARSRRRSRARRVPMRQPDAKNRPTPRTRRISSRRLA